jgi:hypothetical protein
MLEQERHKREEFQQMKVKRRSRSSCWSRRDTRGRRGWNIFISLTSNLQEDTEKKAAEDERRLREMEKERMEYI